MDRRNFPLNFYSSKENADIQLLTSSDPSVIRQLLVYFGIEEEISDELAEILSPSSGAKYAVMLLRNPFDPPLDYAYTGVLEYDLDGLRNGYVAVFRSKSGNRALLERECGDLHAFLSETVRQHDAARQVASV